MKKISFYLIFLFICFSSRVLFSQVVINEITNANIIAIGDENGEYNDWIELYNPGLSEVKLINYAITDEPGNLRKWIFPDVKIEPGSFKIIFASSNDIKSGDTLHTNFKINPKGESIILSNDKGNIIDQYSIGNLQNDHSFGRKPDGSLNWCLFDKPTPSTTNNNSTCYDGYEAAPIFSLNAGFYRSSQIVELYTGSPTGVIRYTLDGNIPAVSANSYSSPINIDKTMVVSAICYSTGNRLPSKPLKRTYFIDDTIIDLPVFSITMDPNDLWDPNTGIYINYEEDWEKKCHIEYFDKQKIKQFELFAGIKIQGNYSRGKDQKSFRILTRKEYGTAWLDYPLIPEKPHIKSYKRFNLRNGGGDYNYTRFRDAFMQRVLKDSPVDRMGYEPALVFLNGEFWGHYEIREQQNTKYILSNHGIPEEQVDMLYHKGSKVRASVGTDKEFHVMYDHITKGDKQKTDFYKSSNEKLDLENFTDYMIAGIYYGNPDWIDHTAPANNIRLWRHRIPEGKWRYMYWDLDMGSGLYNRATESINNLAMVRNPDEANVHSDIFRNLTENKQFLHCFVNRYADLMNTVFQYENIENIVHDMRDSLASSIPRHTKRWGGSFEKWNSDIEFMLDWHKKRIEYARTQLNDEFSLNGQVNVSLATSPEGAGRIKISTIIPDSLPWAGIYYDGVPVTIIAIPNPGFTFENWGVNSNILSPDSNEVISLNISSSDTFTAHFSGSNINPKLTFSEINYHSDSLSNSGDWVELHNYDSIDINLTGWYIKDSDNANIYEIPFGTIIPSGGYIVFSCDTPRFKTQNPAITNYLGQLPFNFKNSGDQIRLFKYDHTVFLSVTYGDAWPWPKSADGKGRTLELKDPETSLDLASNWFAGCPGGSPGSAYVPSCVTAVKEITSQDPFGLKIWPNPSSDIIRISFIPDNTDNNNISFSMYDFTGKEVKIMNSFKNNEIILSRNEFRAGIYVIKIGNEKYSLTKKIVFQ